MVKLPDSVKCRGRRGLVVYPLLLVAAAFILYANSLSGDFVYDDRLQILNNPTIFNIDNLGRAFKEPFWGFAQKDLSQNVANYYRPLFTVAYMLIYRAWGFNPFYFHFVSVGLHALLGIIVFFFANEFIRDRRYSALAAFLFIAHPSQTETVAWVGGLTTAMSGVFIALSLYSYLFRDRFSIPWLGLVLSGLLFFCGLLSKESAIVAPLIIVAGCSFAGSPRSYGEATLHTAFFAVLLALYMAMRFSVFGGFAGSLQYDNLSATQIWATTAGLCLKYILLFLYPVKLSAYHPFQPILSLWNWRFIISLFVIAALILWAWTMWKRGSIFFFYAALASLNLLPVLYLRVLGENVFCDRYLYLPMIGLAIMAAHGFKRLCSRIQAQRGRVSVYMAIAVICAASSAMTINRNFVWHDNLTLYQATLRAAPGVAFFERDYCAEIMRRGDYRAALRCFDHYALKYPGDSRINFNLASLYATLGNRSLGEGALDKAVAWFGKAEKVIAQSRQNTIRDADIFFNMARMKLDLATIHSMKQENSLAERNVASAMELLEECKRINPRYFNAYMLKGGVLLAAAERNSLAKGNISSISPDGGADFPADVKNKLRQAKTEFQTALTINPRGAAALDALGRIYKAQGLCDKAEKEYIEALRYENNNVQFIVNLGAVYLECMNRPELAVEQFLRATEIDPGNSKALYYLGRMGVRLPPHGN